MSVPLDKIDDFLESAKPLYQLTKWKDISMELQEYLFASRLFSKAKPEEMDGPHVRFSIQHSFNDTFKFTETFDPDTTSRTTLLTHGQIGWSVSTVNRTWDLMEEEFSGSEVKIVDYMRVLEHSMYNSYFKGMELAMFGTGPTSATQRKPPPTSLLWWIQPYNTASGAPNELAAYQLAAGTTSAFLGMNPTGFSNTANIDRITYKGWRNRNGTYTAFTQDDAVDSIVRCMDRCHFKNAHAYPDASGDGRPSYEILTTPSRVEEARKLLQRGNDNIRNALDTWKIDTPMLRNAPMIPVWAWSNSEFGLARTDGILMGVNWKSFKFWGKAGRRMVKHPPYRDKDAHNVRWQVMDDSCQITCDDPRTNWVLTSTATVTEQD